jgi:hypothetical protein
VLWREVVSVSVWERRKKGRERDSEKKRTMVGLLVYPHDLVAA